MSSISRPLLILAVSLLQASAAWAQLPARHEISIDGIVFSLPQGLRIEKVADQPLVKWPIVADWDSQGRLVIAESGGVGRPIQEQNKLALHRIVRLVDDDQDGTFDRRIVAADTLAFPEGVLCLGNDILVSAPPVIWKLTDADHDGVCEERQIWFDGNTVTGCANDLHGPYLGRDGWIYWCKGAFAEQTHEMVNGRTLKSSAAHIFRRHPNSQFLEPLISGGMDNPVEMAFTPEGEKFFTSTFLQHPGGGLRDGIGHAVYGGLFGKDHHVVEGHVRTGSLMPVMTQLGPAAPSGLISLDSDHLIGSLKHSSHDRFLSAALFNLHKVTAHRLIPEGASFRTEDHDLLVTDRVDFHPTDVIEDADGSLLVLDTGGWYDLCCPTSRIDQKTAEGGIYRITSEASRSVVNSNRTINGDSLALETAISLLSDPRTWVARHAAEVVVAAANASVASLKEIIDDSDRDLDDRLTALWTLCRIGNEASLSVAASQLGSPENSLAQAACHIVSIHQYRQATSSLEQLLDHPSAGVRRAAAEGLGRIAGEEAVDTLLAALEASIGDRHLEHSLLYALVEIVRRNPETELKDRATTDTRLYAAILVLEQLGRGVELDPAQLFHAAQRDNDPLRRAAVQALSSHPEWASDSAESLQRLWTELDSNTAASDVLVEVIAGWSEDRSIADLVGGWIAEIETASPRQQAFLAENLYQCSTHRLWPQWSQPIAKWMEHSNADLKPILATSLAQLDLSDNAHTALVDGIVDLASQADSETLRLKLLSSVPLKSRIADLPAEAEVVAAFVDRNGNQSDLAAQVLLRCNLSRSQAQHLVESLTDVPPQHLMTAIESIHRSGIIEVEQAMLSRLLELPSARTLPRGFVTNLYSQAEKTLRAEASRVTAVLESPPEDIQQAVNAKLAQLSDGDPVRGLQVFRGQRASCSNCHRMGYIGKEIGPDLTRIGRSRTAEALLEAILFPSARLEQSYQSTRVLTVDGQIHNGLIVSQNATAIEIQLNAERRVLIPRDQIDQMEPSDVSVMPEGMDKVLSRQELSDLLALLQSAI